MAYGDEEVSLGTSREPGPAEAPAAPPATPTSEGGLRGAPLTSDQLTELFGLLPGADSVELKVTVPEEGHRSTIAALGIDALDAQIRQVFFFDTPDLVLYQAGVVVRARRIQGKGADTVVKLRPVIPEEIGRDLRMSAAFSIEVDAMPGGFVCSGSLKSRADASEVRRAVLGDLPVRKIFSKEQRALFKSHAPEGLKLADLATLGPIFVLKVRFTPAELNQKLVAELWLHPDGSRILELSTKCAPDQTLAVLAKTRAYLDERGVDRSGDQQAKTKRALTFFANELKEAPAG